MSLNIGDGYKCSLMANPLLSLSRSAIFYCVLSLLLAELVVSKIVGWPNEQAEPPYLRNETPYRGWPEYVSNVEKKRDIVLLGNSQGVGTELPDVSSIYAAQVNDALARHDHSIALHNWSVTGLLAHQLELLSLKALSHGPELIVLSVSLHNFNPTGKLTLSRDETDISLMTWDTTLLSRDLLSSSLIRNTSKDGLIRAWLNRVSATARSRTALFDWLASKVPWRLHRLIFGHSRPQPVLTPIYERTEILEPAPIRHLQIKSPEAHWDKQFRGKQLPVAVDYYEWLNRQAEKRGTRLLWIWMPFARRDDTSTILRSMGRIHTEFCAQLKSDGNQCVDLSQALQPDKFISGDLSSHLTRPGHSEMAGLLTKEILDALY